MTSDMEITHVNHKKITYICSFERAVTFYNWFEITQGNGSYTSQIKLGKGLLQVLDLIRTQRVRHYLREGLEGIGI